MLAMLDAPLLAEHNCWFGRGTAIVRPRERSQREQQG